MALHVLPGSVPGSGAFFSFKTVEATASIKVASGRDGVLRYGHFFHNIQLASHISA
jgi:hypothetical protein